VTRVEALETMIVDELSRAAEVPARSVSDAFAREANELFLDLVDEE
jgi:uncharacterized protein